MVGPLTALGEEMIVALETLDRERYKSLLHPEMVMVTVPDWPDGGEFHGRDACWRFLEGFLAVFPPGDGRFEMIDPIERGDRMLATLRRVAKGGRSGAQVVFSVGLVATVRDELVMRQEFYRTREEALAAFVRS
jgi:ketosteroid isomerase-like protein